MCSSVLSVTAIVRVIIFLLVVLIPKTSGCMSGTIDEIAVVGGTDGIVYFFDLSANQTLCTINFGRPNMYVVPVNSTTVALFSKFNVWNTIWVLNTQYPLNLANISLGKYIEVGGVAFDSTNNYLINGNYDGTVQVWNMTNFASLNYYQQNSPVRAIYPLSNGKVASGEDGGYVKIWDPLNFNTIWSFNTTFANLGIAQINSDLIAIVGYSSQLWIVSIVNGTIIKTFSRPGSDAWWVSNWPTNMLVVTDCSGYIRTIDWTTTDVLSSNQYYSGCTYQLSKIANGKLMMAWINFNIVALYDLSSSGILSTPASYVIPGNIVTAEFIDSYLEVSIVCSVASLCSTSTTDITTQANEDIVLVLSCTGDCTSSYVNKDYSWKVSQNTGTLINPVWKEITITQQSYVQGTDISQLTLIKNLFSDFSAINYKVELEFYVNRMLGVKVFTSSITITTYDKLLASVSQLLSNGSLYTDVSQASVTLSELALILCQAGDISSLSSAEASSFMSVMAQLVDVTSSLLPVTQVSDIISVSSVLSIASSNPVIVSSDTAVLIGSLCEDLVSSLAASASNVNTFTDASSNILEAVTNSQQIVNVKNLDGSVGNIVSKYKEKLRLICSIYLIYLIVDSNQIKSILSSTVEVINAVSDVANQFLSEDDTIHIQQKNIDLVLAKTAAENIETEQRVSGCQIDFSDPCQMLGYSTVQCASNLIVSQSFSMPYAFVGVNGNNGLYISESQSVGLKFFTNGMTERPVSNFDAGIYFWIGRNSDQDIPFEQVIIDSSTYNSSQNQLVPFKTNLSTPYQSIIIDIMPNNLLTVGYLIVLKYGKTPVISSINQLYDSFLIGCPSDLKNEAGQSFYRLFSNVSANTGLDTVAGFGFRQLAQYEFEYYCVNGSQSTQTLVLPNSFDFSTLFTASVSQRVFGAGCYYLDESTAEWSSSGAEVLADTNTTHTHCVSKHLTQFAGGLVILPASIDFDNVWANASFTKNLTIYLTVIIISSLYLILLLLCRYQDWKDDNKRSVFILADNGPFDQYFYELIVFTGGRKNAGTHSNVSLIVGGNELETDVRTLVPNREYHKNGAHALQRGSVQSFLMSVERSLGAELRYIRIWHDNSGRGQHASWFLKFIIVHDLQNRDKFYFICNDWLAVDQSDGKINRLLPVATRKQQTELKYLMEKETKQKMSDGHLWFSILARPITSPFTRTDRVTCAFVLLCITMLVNILYYEQASNSSSTSNQLVVGPFNFSSTQIVIGVISNLLIFPPSFLLMQIFRKSRRRVTKTSLLKNNLKKCLPEENIGPSEEVMKKQPKKKVKRSFTLPWWFKIIGYILAACFMGVSIFFIIVKGISFGDDMCRKWLTAFLISVVTSIVFTQPIQVILLSIFVVLLFKKSNDDADLEDDHLEDGRPLTNTPVADKNDGINNTIPTQVTNSFSDKDFWSEEHLEEVKRKRKLEQKAWTIIKKLLVYALFLGLLFNVAYSKTSSKSFLYQTQLQNLMLQNISKVQTPENVWSWVEYQFFPSITLGKEWYNSDSTGSKYQVGDYSSILVGKIQLRIARVKSTSCSRIINTTCYLDYGVSSYDDSDYGCSWSSSSSASCDTSDAFKYKSALSINSQPYAGQYSNYLGGGYVYSVDAVNSNLSQIQQNLANLMENDWIDRSARALFIEYTVYNVNVDLFCYCTILFEFLPSGSIVASLVFDPISLFADEAIIYVAIGIAYMFIVVFLMLNEIKQAIKMKKGYFTQWWSYANWALIALTWAAFVMYLNRLYEKEYLLKKLKSDDDEIINFQLLNYWNQLLMIFLGFCCFLASIKVIQLVSFSRSVSFIFQVFKQSFIELAAFMVFYVILFMAYTQAMYLIVYDRNSQFRSFASSLVTGFLMLIGKFNVDSFCQDAGNIVGPIIFCTFAVTMIMILLNMFITVLTDGFSQIRNEYRADHQAEESLMLVFAKERVWPSVLSLLALRRMFRGKSNSASGVVNQYKENVSAFEDRVSDLTKISKKMARNI